MWTPRSQGPSQKAQKASDKAESTSKQTNTRMKEFKYFSKTAFQLREYSISLSAESDSEVEQINAN